MVRSYSDLPSWGAIAERLPEPCRITPDAQPEERFWTWGGHAIHIDHYRNPAARARVILLHGVGGNGRLLSFIGAPLCRRGYEVIAPDLPPYGLSRTDPKSTLAYGDWIELVSALIDAESAHDPRPLFLFGLSAGGMLAYQVACINRRVAGVIATCLLDQRLPAVRDGSAANRVISRIGAPLLRPLARIAPGIRLPMRAVAKMKALVNDPGLLRLLIQDRRSAGASVPLGFLISMIEAAPAVEPERFDHCPLLLVHPAQDRWIPVGLSRLFFDRLACAKGLVMLEQAGHFPIESPGFEQMEGAVAEFIGQAVEGAAGRGEANVERMGPTMKAAVKGP